MKYTQEQIIWLKENVPNMTFKEATETFNKTFDTNKNIKAIKTL